MINKSLSLHHIIKEPEIKNEKNEALFLLHGYGSNEEDLFSFASELPKNLFIISIRAPYELQPLGYAWYAINIDAEHGKWSNDEQAIESRDKIVAFIDECIDVYNLDTDNINLLGFSQGTILSFAIALSYPEKIKKVIGLSGYINKNILTENYSKKDFANLSIYSSHGMFDQIIQLDWARNTPTILSDLKINHVFKEFPSAHNVSLQNFTSFKEWLKLEDN